jgi:hemerythrin
VHDHDGSTPQSCLGNPTFSQKKCQRLSGLGRETPVGIRKSEITSAVELHFDTEEAYMRKICLPQSSYSRHVGEHEKILDALYRIGAHAADLKSVGVADLLGYLRRWFGGHLMDSDFEIKRYAAR